MINASTKIAKPNQFLLNFDMCMAVLLFLEACGL